MSKGTVKAPCIRICRSFSEPGGLLNPHTSDHSPDTSPGLHKGVGPPNSQVILAPLPQVHFPMMNFGHLPHQCCRSTCMENSLGGALAPRNRSNVVFLRLSLPLFPTDPLSLSPYQSSLLPVRGQFVSSLLTSQDPSVPTWIQLRTLRYHDK